MLILFVALIFGIVVLLLLLRSMKGGIREQLSYAGLPKLLSILKLLLLVMVIIYILLFIVVIIKTIMI